MSSTNAVDHEDDIDLDEDPGVGLPSVGGKDVKERTRRGLAYFLLALVSLIAIGGQVVIAGFIRPLTWEMERDFLTVVFVPIITATSTALGFFFGEHVGHSSPH